MIWLMVYKKSIKWLGQDVNVFLNNLKGEELEGRFQQSYMDPDTECDN